MRPTILLVTCVLLASTSFSQDPFKEAKIAAEKAAAEAAKKAKLPVAAPQDDAPTAPKPGPEHVRMSAWTGEFTSAAKMWPAPGMDPITWTGTLKSKLDFNGFFYVGEDNAEMMGAQFLGRMTIGFDPMKKKYVGVWIDSMGPFSTVTEGDWDEASKSLNLVGDMLDIATSAKNVKTRFVTKMVDQRTQTFHLFQPGPDGKEAKIMEITYTRTK